MKYIRMLSFFVFLLLLAVPSKAQAVEEVHSPKLGMFTDNDGQKGVLLIYTGVMDHLSITSVKFGVGSCEYEFPVRLKKNDRAQLKSVFILDPQGVITIDAQRVYVNKMPINGMWVTSLPYNPKKGCL